MRCFKSILHYNDKKWVEFYAAKLAMWKKGSIIELSSLGDVGVKSK